ncbi:hypothetical protein H5T55_02660 [Candidatus Bipolaricaulota bacterium]|nr:hypothetical protein [Candidatus Bipolaricaulota bacterium]
MAKLGWVIALVLALGLAGAAACPPVGLPVTQVYSTGEGIYGVWIQNCAPISHNTFKIVFHVPVGDVTAVAINGTQVLEISGTGNVRIVKLAGAGVKPGGYLVLTVKGVSPAVEATCEALFRFVFTTPPVYCR